MKKISSFSEYQEQYKKSVEHPEEFWAEIASTFTWNKKWDKVLEWDFEDLHNSWFKGAKLNITENCIDRHLDKNGDKIAIIWEPNDPADETVNITYSQLHERVGKAAQMLKNNGILKGDRVCLYMPDRKSTRLNSSHDQTSYAVFCLKKK